MIISEGGCTVSKVRDYPDYSCVLGDTIVESGVHRWKLKVSNVSSMWAGVTRSVTEAQLGSSPGAITNVA